MASIDTHLTVRMAEVGDAPEIARLLAVLGHPTDTVAVANRWSGWAAAGNTALVATLGDTRLAGLATLHHMTVLHRPCQVGRVTALVVDVPWRGRGVGRVLIAAAEEMLAQAGCGLVEVTSHARNADAHAFYEQVGYGRTGVRLAKVLEIALEVLP